MTGECAPVAIRDRWLARFTATEANGTALRNIILSGAVPAQGGVPCADGMWRSPDGDGEGMAPFRVLTPDGMRRRSP